LIASTQYENEWKLRISKLIMIDIKIENECDFFLFKQTNKKNEKWSTY
jgi:hypothetical protein